MRRYVLFLFLLISCTSWAQQRTTFFLDKDYDQIVVDEGWDAHLIQTAEYNNLLLRRSEEYDPEVNQCVLKSLNRIEVCIPGGVKSSDVFILKNGVLRLKKNASLPQGTRVDIFTAQRISRIELRPRAKLTSSRLEGYGELMIAQREQSRLVVDTLASSSLLLGFLGDSCYLDCKQIEVDQLLTDLNQGTCYGRLPIKREGSDRSVEKSYHGPMSRILPVWTEAPNVRFDDRFSLHIGAGARVLYNLANNEVFNITNTAYFNRRFNLSASVYGKWKFNRCWDIKTGLQFDAYYTPFYSMNSEYFGETESFSYVRKRINMQFAFGVPMSVTYHPSYHKPEALGINFELLPSIISLSDYSLYTDTESIGHNDSFSNPFRLELRVGVESNVLGIFHGLHFFVNLLPTYVNVPNANRYREFGIGISF